MKPISLHVPSQLVTSRLTKRVEETISEFLGNSDHIFHAIEAGKGAGSGGGDEGGHGGEEGQEQEGDLHDCWLYLYTCARAWRKVEYRSEYIV